MTTIQSIQFLVAINLVVIGLSHFLQAKIWVEFFRFLAAKGMVGNIFNALMSLALGSLIVSFHLVWEWPAVMVTIYGILQLIKGSLYLIYPAVGLRSIQKVDNKSAKFKWVGLVMSGLGLLIISQLWVQGTFVG